MAIIIFLFFLFFPQSIFATPIVQITDFSSNSDPEWVQLTNTTNETINLTNWYFKDQKDNVKSINICLSANSKQVLIYNAGWLNNSKGIGETYADIIYLYDNLSSTPIDIYPYTIGTSKPQPESTNTCILPSPTPTLIPTIAPTNTPIPTFSPTLTPTLVPDYIINPSSGITLTEYMPYSTEEWIEIYNNNDSKVKLIGWKIYDNDSNSKNFPETVINSKSYFVFKFSSFLDNNEADKIVLKNQNNDIIGESSYNNGLLTVEKSWSLINDSWCQALITQGYSNSNSCYISPTNTIIPTITPTKTFTSTSTPILERNLYTTDAASTAAAIFIPIEEDIFLSPTPTTAPTTSISGQILGQKSTNKKNFLPLFFILSGGTLLLSPLIFNKIKKK